MDDSIGGMEESNMKDLAIASTLLLVQYLIMKHLNFFLLFVVFLFSSLFSLFSHFSLFPLSLAFVLILHPLLHCSSWV